MAGPTFPVTVGADIREPAKGKEQEPIGYLLKKCGVDSGFYFVTPGLYLHVEYRFRELYTPVYLGRDTVVPSQADIAWSILEQLRAPEGASVTLICDNPDFNGQPNCAIEVCDDWTDWKARRFTGDTMIEALQAALSARGAQK